MRTTIQQSLIGVIVAASMGAPVQAAAPPDRAALDKSVYTSLKEVINRGADFYNSGDPAACYHLYHGALMAIESVLDHYPELQKEIKNGLAEAELVETLVRRLDGMLRNGTRKHYRNTLTYTLTFTTRTTTPMAISIPRVSPAG